MRLLNLTLPTPAENLALDDALVQELDTGLTRQETLRLWEPSAPFVVLGRSSPLTREVNQAYCREAGIAVVRRVSGGQTVLAGPGCLMYAVTLDLRVRPQLGAIETAHRFVLSHLQGALRTLGITAQIQGTSDLVQETAEGWKKFSGNSLRVLRHALLYHGTLLYGLPARLIEEALGTPIRQPGYRNSRRHEDFLMGLGASRKDLERSLVDIWQAHPFATNWPSELTRTLVAEKYGCDAWTAKV